MIAPSCQIMLVLGLILSSPAPAASPNDWREPTEATRLQGLATYMAPGVMELAAENTGRSLDGVIGGVALNRAGDIGRLVWIERAGRYYGPLRVVDCAQAGPHYEAREALGRVVEVDFQLAAEWGTLEIGPTPVTVWLVEPPIGAQNRWPPRIRNPQAPKEAY